MSNMLSHAELCEQTVELLPARTVMSLLSGSGGTAGTPGSGGTATGGFGWNFGNYTTGHQINIVGRAFPGLSGSAH